MLQQDDEVIVIVIAGTIMLLLLGIFIISFVFFYQRKRNSHIAQQEQLTANFQKEFLKAQLEIQEQTLQHISREIHDNVTQVLSFVKLTLAMKGKLDEAQKQVKINESRELIAHAITDLRDLSKTLSFEHINTIGLIKTIELEVERINKSGIIEVLFLQEGDVYSLGEERELVLFRIFQESLNNALKHSGAGHFKITLQYHSDLFNLTLEDDGSGFSTEVLDNKSGSGLKNIENRAALIGGISTIDSAPGKGCSVKVTLKPFKQQLHANGRTHPDSLS
ncbi:MAG: ATP-binding protein [Mucilaginibacter sp.]